MPGLTNAVRSCDSSKTLVNALVTAPQGATANTNGIGARPVPKRSTSGFSAGSVAWTATTSAQSDILPAAACNTPQARSVCGFCSFQKNTKANFLAAAARSRAAAALLCKPDAARPSGKRAVRKPSCATDRRTQNRHHQQAESPSFHRYLPSMTRVCGGSSVSRNETQLDSVEASPNADDSRRADSSPHRRAE